jgi:hypothetical protein
MKKVAIVTFPDTESMSPSFGKKYNFVTDIKDLQKGDKVVAETVNGLKIVDFVEYTDPGFGDNGIKLPSRWIIQKIDMETHKKRQEAANRLAKLKAMMETERRKAQELEIYEILAKENPALATLLEEFKQLQEVL